jgi:hypothetical protein
MFQYNTQRKFVRGRTQGEEEAILALQFARELVLDGPGCFANLALTPSATSRKPRPALPRAEEE